MKKVVVYSTNWCADCVRSTYFLDSKKIPYTEIDIEKDIKAYKRICALNNGSITVPTIVITDEKGTEQVLVEPSNEQLGKTIGVEK